MEISKVEINCFDTKYVSHENEDFNDQIIGKIIFKLGEYAIIPDPTIAIISYFEYNGVTNTSLYLKSTEINTKTKK